MYKGRLELDHQLTAFELTPLILNITRAGRNNDNG